MRPLLASAAVALGLSACTMSETLNRTDPNKPLITQIDAKRQPKLGDAGTGLLNQRADGKGIVSTPVLDAELNGFLAELLKGWPGQPVPIRVYVMPEEGFEAYAAADGSIFIATGMLTELEFDDELAAVLAHEAAHILRGHMEKSVFSDIHRVATNIGALALTATGGSQFGVMAKSAAAWISVEAGQSGLFPAWSRQQEEEADQLASDLLRRAGYSAEGLTKFLERMEVWEARRAEQQQRYWETAKQKMKEDAAKLNRPGQQAAAEATGELDISMQQELARMRRQHDAADQRAATIDAYQQRMNYFENAPDLRRERVARLGNDAATRRMLAHVDRTNQAHAALFEGSPAKALEALVTPAAAPAAQNPRTGTGNRPPARPRPAPQPSAQTLNDGTVTGWGEFIRARVLEANNDQAGSSELTRRALSHEQSLMRSHLGLVYALEQQGQMEEAYRALEATDKQFGAPLSLLPDIIRLARLSGRGVVSNVAQVRCATQGTPELKKACAQAANQSKAAAAATPSSTNPFSNLRSLR